MTKRSDWNDDSPFTLREAAEVLLNGVVKAATLRAAIDRGDLASEKLGRVFVVTPRHIRDWRERSKVPAKNQRAENERRQREVELLNRAAQQELQQITRDLARRKK